MMTGKLPAQGGKPPPASTGGADRVRHAHGETVHSACEDIGECHGVVVLTKKDSIRAVFFCYKG